TMLHSDVESRPRQSVVFDAYGRLAQRLNFRMCGRIARGDGPVPAVPYHGAFRDNNCAYRNLACSFSPIRQVQSLTHKASVRFAPEVARIQLNGRIHRFVSCVGTLDAPYWPIQPLGASQFYANLRGKGNACSDTFR